MTMSRIHFQGVGTTMVGNSSFSGKDENMNTKALNFTFLALKEFFLCNNLPSTFLLHSALSMINRHG